ncbi:MAG: hypothetical protein SNJ75_14765 [Gemmataceae bacterium]
MMPALFLAPFAADVTPPVGHPLCGGWIEPVRAVDDPLRAMGLVLLGSEAPVVLCAVDWCGIRNEAHRAWREALAKAAHTTPQRVAVQSVHPHNAPFVDTVAQKYIDAHGGSPANLESRFFSRCLAQLAQAVQDALKKPLRFDAISTGRASVDRVASNRRVLGKDGKVRFTRTSATRDPEARAAPEGLIDPYLRCLGFWHGDRPLLAVHYYATHPMSYYGDGRVTSDFCGLARDELARASRLGQIYFTGCAGNITAGKYNDGAKTNRMILRDRMLMAMRASWRASRRQVVTQWKWHVEPFAFEPRHEAGFTRDASEAVLKNPKASRAARGNAAFQLAWLDRIKTPIDLTCLQIGSASVVHLPGEPFIEYQLTAQALHPDRFVCVAGYGDGGPGYLPTDLAYLEGGYEPTVALAAPCEKRFKTALQRLLGKPV